MSSKLLVFGGGGQVGRSLLEAASKASIEAIGLGHTQADICSRKAITECIRAHAPTTVVNAAAYTAVDQAETEPDLAFNVNWDGARIVAEAAASAGIPVIHLSTDYVFDGKKRIPYAETDETNPLGVYGQSKEAGEHAVQEANPRHVILRTSGVYSPYGTNFVRTMLRLGKEREELRIVDDQTVCPTAAADIASAIVTISRQAENKGFGAFGLYHYAGVDPVTWYGFATLIFEIAERFGVERPKLKPISSADFGAPAPRPAYSVLKTAKIRGFFAVNPRLLRLSLAECLRLCWRNGFNH